MTPILARPLRALIFFSWIVFISTYASAEFDHPYERPLIETVAAHPLPAVIAPNRWALNKEGMMRFLAEAVTFYPNETLYFLARDGEYLYDMARLLFKDAPTNLSRMKLLNVSRTSKESDDLVNYLMQEGFTEDRLSKQRAVLIDTCCEGTIDEEIRLSLPRWSEGRIASQLLSSGNSEIPASRVYLETHSPGKDINMVNITENIPHYTNTAIDYHDPKGVWVAVSAEAMPEYTKQYALAIMEDIKHFCDDPTTIRRFRTILRDMIIVVGAARGLGEINPENVLAALARLKAKGIHSFLHDLRDAADCDSAVFPRKQLANFWKMIPEGKPKINRGNRTLEASSPWPPHLAPYFEGGGTAKLLKLTPEQRPLLLELLPHLSFETAKKLVALKPWSQDIDVALHLLQTTTDLVDAEFLTSVLKKPHWASHPRSSEILRHLSGEGLDFGNEIPPFFKDMFRDVTRTPSWQNHPDIIKAKKNAAAQRLSQDIRMTEMHKFYQTQITTLLEESRRGAVSGEPSHLHKASTSSREECAGQNLGEQIQSD